MQNSTTIGSDGFPIVSYYDNTNKVLKVAHCKDIKCTSTSVTIVDDSTARVGEYSSITISTTGNPIISYYDGFNGNLKIAFCNNIQCTDTTIKTLDSLNDVGRYTSIAIGSDDFPILSYYDLTLQNLKLAHCKDKLCENFEIKLVDDVGSVGRYSSITIGGDGLALVSYEDYTN